MLSYFCSTLLLAMIEITLVVAIHCSPVVPNNFGYSAIAAIVVPLVDFAICLLFGSGPIFVDLLGLPCIISLKIPYKVHVS